LICFLQGLHKTSKPIHLVLKFCANNESLPKPHIIPENLLALPILFISALFVSRINLHPFILSAIQLSKFAQS
jgi:hypothetical protein